MSIWDKPPAKPVIKPRAKPAEHIKVMPDKPAILAKSGKEHDALVVCRNVIQSHLSQAYFKKRSGVWLPVLKLIEEAME